MKKRKLTVAALTLALSSLTASQAWAADVPAGVKLAAKQELVRNNGAEVASLDPHKVEGVPESHVLRDLLEGLTITDLDGRIIPGAAESWENKDYKVWTFHLRKDAKWSNGDPVTAQDFVYSWQRLVTPATASPYASYFEYAHIENVEDIIAGKKKPEELGVKAIDDHTLEVTLSVPVPYFYKMLAHTSTKPVNKKVVEQFGDRWTQPENWVGNGAYKLKNWVVNERLVLERNPHYWENAKTVINQVTYLPIASEVTDVNRYRAGDTDMTNSYLPIELFKKLKAEIPEQVHADPYLCVYFYEFNNAKPPFNDVRVRTAFKLALDRETIVEKVKAQGDLPAYSFTPPYTDGIGKLAAPEWKSWSQEKRNQEAIKLLEEAGYSKSNPVKASLLYNTSDLHKKLGIAASSIWKKNLGGLAEVTLENQEWKTFLDARRLGNHQIARGGWCADYNEPSSFLATLQSNSSNNRFFYKSPEFDGLIAKSVAVKSEQEREAVYQEMEALIDKDSVMAPVYHYANLRLVKPHVGGYTGKDPLDYISSKNFYIIDKE